ESDAINSNFKLEVDGISVDCISTPMQVGYAHFSFMGKVRVDLTTSEPIKTVDLSPHRLGIKSQASGNRLSFWIDRPCKLHLRVNQLPRFFIFADRLEKQTPDLSARK